MEIRSNHFRYLVCAILMYLTIPAMSQTYNKPGGTGAQFLKLGVTARAEALGQAIVAEISDATAVFYNPAGINNIQNMNFAAGYTQMPANVTLSFFCGGFSIANDQTLAVSVLALRTDEMLVRTILRPEGTGEKFEVANYAFGLTYARTLTDKLKLGLTARYLWMNLVSGIFTQHSWSADLGIQYETDLPGVFKGLELGVAVMNFGSDVKYIHEGFGLPLRYTVGISKPFEIAGDSQVVFGINWTKLIDEEQKTQLGLEYKYDNFIMLRGGYKFVSDAQSWSMGLGIVPKIAEKTVMLDYAYSDFDILGQLHRVSLSLNL